MTAGSHTRTGDVDREVGAPPTALGTKAPWVIALAVVRYQPTRATNKGSPKDTVPKVTATLKA